MIQLTYLLTPSHTYGQIICLARNVPTETNLHIPCDSTALLISRAVRGQGTIYSKRLTLVSPLPQNEEQQHGASAELFTFINGVIDKEAQSVASSEVPPLAPEG